MSSRTQCAPNCARVGPHKTCIAGLGAAMAADTRRDTPVVLAAGVVRDCLKQDRAEARGLTGVAAVTSWREAASQAGDSAVVDAIDLLGLARAAQIYDARSGRALQLDTSEKTRLARAAEKARAR